MSYDWFTQEKCPCDACDQALVCKENELACRAFSYYILNGTMKSYTARMPTKNMFNRIFTDDDIALKKYMKSITARENYYQQQLFEAD